MTAALVATRRPCPLCGARKARRSWLEKNFEYVCCVACGAFFTDVAEDCYEELRHNAWDVLSLAPSESVTLILTSVWAGPAGKLQSKLPPAGLTESEPAT